MDNVRPDPAGDPLAAYQRRVVTRFTELKSAADPAELRRRSIALERGAGWLVPLCRMHEGDAELIATLARWRVRNMAVYPTQFTVTVEGTAAWLRDRVLAVADRLLFLVQEPGGRPVGTVGLSDALTDMRALRLESVMRGTDDAPRSIMQAAVAVLLTWTREQLKPDLVRAYVFSDNRPIISLLHRVGFREQGLTPLRKQIDGDRTEFLPAEDPAARADRSHLHMVLGMTAHSGDRACHSEDRVSAARNDERGASALRDPLGSHQGPDVA